MHHALESAEITPGQPIGMVQQAEHGHCHTTIPAPVDNLGDAELKARSPIGMVQQAELNSARSHYHG